MSRLESLVSGHEFTRAVDMPPNRWALQLADEPAQALTGELCNKGMTSVVPMMPAKMRRALAPATFSPRTITFSASCLIPALISHNREAHYV
jgi:hypothetical protein